MALISFYFFVKITLAKVWRVDSCWSRSDTSLLSPKSHSIPTACCITGEPLPSCPHSPLPDSQLAASQRWQAAGRETCRHLEHHTGSPITAALGSARLGPARPSVRPSPHLPTRLRRSLNQGWWRQATASLLSVQTLRISLEWNQCPLDFYVCVVFGFYLRKHLQAIS